MERHSVAFLMTNRDDVLENIDDLVMFCVMVIWASRMQVIVLDKEWVCT